MRVAKFEAALAVDGKTQISPRIHMEMKQTTFGCIVKISSVRSVDNRRSRSVIGIDNVEVEDRDTEVAAVS